MRRCRFRLQDNEQTISAIMIQSVRFSSCIFCGLVLTACIAMLLPISAVSQNTFNANGLMMILDDEGYINTMLVEGREIADYSSGKIPLIRVKVDTAWLIPIEGIYYSNSNRLYLAYWIEEKEELVEVVVAVEEKDDYLSFEVTEVNPDSLVNALVWGPYSVRMEETIGEIIGVVSGDSLAFGLQVLNVKTLGGFPLNTEGSDPSRSSTAVKTATGSAVQAYSLDRSRSRTIDAWWGQFRQMPVEAVPGETVSGSRIALFGCYSDQVLQRIEAIELTENLPHPTIFGIWDKRSTEKGRSYLIADYSEETIDELLAYTHQANLMTLYHMNAWKSWGHYELNAEYFPNGLEGVKNCWEKANRLGIRLGAHTLTDFINTNDPYVTPVPDPRLAITGSSVLTWDINEIQTEIPVASAFYFANEKANWMRTVRIGNELVQYDTVTGDAPAWLKGCTRGAFGTVIASHSPGPVARNCRQSGKTVQRNLFQPDGFRRA
jgi:hypothetical protein